MVQAEPKVLFVFCFLIGFCIIPFKMSEISLVFDQRIAQILLYTRQKQVYSNEQRDSMPRPEASIGLVVQELVRRSNEEGRRVRDLEQRVETLEGRLTSIEQLILERFKKSDQRATAIETSLKAVDETLLKLRAAVDKISKQLEKTATKTEVKELERAFELIQPEIHQVKSA